MTDQPTPATPDSRPLAVRFADAFFHRGPRYDPTPAPTKPEPGSDTDQAVRGVQQWMALDLHQALGRPFDPKADHQGHASWADWWAELCASVRKPARVDYAQQEAVTIEADLAEFLAELADPAPDNSRTTEDNPPTSDAVADNHVCKPDATTYYCPTAGEIESDCHGGFDVCCARPDLHQPLIDPLTIPADTARALHDVLGQLLSGHEAGLPGDRRTCCGARIGHYPGCTVGQAGAEEERLRELYEAAILEWHCDPHGPPYTEAADVVLAIRDTAMEQLRQERDDAAGGLAEAQEHNEATCEAVKRADRAEARAADMEQKVINMGGHQHHAEALEEELVTARSTLDRVRTLHARAKTSFDDVCTHCSERDYPNYEVAWPCPTIAALDQPGGKYL